MKLNNNFNNLNKSILVRWFNKIFFINYILFVFISFNLFASPIHSHIKRLSVQQGLPNNTLYSLAKDHNGYLWIGTPTGLARFDGKRFLVFSAHSKDTVSIVNSEAGNIFIDSKQRLWVSSWNNGLFLYDKSLHLLHQFHHDQTNNNSLCSNKVQTFFEDNQKQIWLGTSGGGLCLYHETSHNFTTFRHNENDKNSLSNNRVWSIAQTKDGTLWVATSVGLNRLRLGVSPKFIKYFHHKTKKASLSDSLVRNLLVDSQDRLWIGTEHGFDYFEKNTEIFIHLSPQSKEFIAPITRMREGKNNDIWVGTEQGLFRFLPSINKFAPIENKKLRMFPNDDIRDIYIENNGSMWIATRFGGLININYTPNIFTTYNTFMNKKGMISHFKQVDALFEDSLNIIWFATDQGLLYLAPNTKLIKQFSRAKAFKSYIITGIDEDNKGKLWLSGSFGLYTINKARTMLHNENNLIATLKYKGINKSLFLPDNTLLIGTNFEGLVKVKNKIVSHFKHHNKIISSLNGNGVNDIFRDNRGNIWVATSDGNIDKIVSNRNFIIHYQLKSSNNKNIIVHTIFQTHDGNLWLGTQHSLFKLNKITDVFQPITNINLINHNIKSINEDNYGDLWLGTSTGLTQYKRKQRYITNFTHNAGIQNMIFLARATLKTHDNRLFFGGTNGITEIIFKRLYSPLNIGKVMISSVWLDQTSIKQYRFKEDQPIKVFSSIKNIKIRFTSPNLNQIKKNEYTYFLKNFDTHFGKPTSNNTVSYNNLLAGRYVFYVKKFNDNENKIPNVAKLTIIVLPKWWQYWWVKVIEGILLFTLLYMWFKFRTKKLAYQKNELEKIIVQRSQMLIEIQTKLIESDKNIALSNLVVGIAHEMNTPMGISVTAISHTQELSLELLNDVNHGKLNKHVFSKKIHDIQEGAKIALRNINKTSNLINSFKSVSIDQLSKEKIEFNINDHLNEVINKLNPQLNKANITVNINCPKSIDIKSYPDAIAQIISSLVLNAIIHGFENMDSGEIIIDVEHKKESIKLKIKDNGQGISETNRKQIFDPFYTTKRRSGMLGLGLHIVQNILVQKLNGTIHCKSELNKGCCFNIKFLI